MQANLTVIISVFLALVATISPILTSLINNAHDSKMKELDLKREHYNNTIGHEQDIFENYLRCVGRCIAVTDLEASKEYSEYYFLSILYVADDLRTEMNSIHRCMEEGDWEKATLYLQRLIPKLNDLLQSRKNSN